MITPTCPKNNCEGKTFELVSNTLFTGQYPPSLVCCSTCGAVVGVFDTQLHVDVKRIPIR